MVEVLFLYIKKIRKKKMDKVQLTDEEKPLRHQHLLDPRVKSPLKNAIQTHMLCDHRQRYA